FRSPRLATFGPRFLAVPCPSPTCVAAGVAPTFCRPVARTTASATSWTEGRSELADSRPIEGPPLPTPASGPSPRPLSYPPASAQTVLRPVAAPRQLASQADHLASAALPWPADAPGN